jgi:hypothetical protein
MTFQDETARGRGPAAYRYRGYRGYRRTSIKFHVTTFKSEKEVPDS